VSRTAPRFIRPIGLGPILSLIARTGAPQASATGRDRTSVRAGSVAHRDHMGTSGHQWLPTAKRNHRSMSIRLKQQARGQQADQIVVPKVTVRRRAADGQQLTAVGTNTTVAELWQIVGALGALLPGLPAAFHRSFPVSNPPMYRPVGARWI
jgi:hypothetical protein